MPRSNNIAFDKSVPTILLKKMKYAERTDKKEKKISAR
jgi:hypothetical protein